MGPVHYHKADRQGIGFDRTATGSNALVQYVPAAVAQWRDAAARDQNYLLWFHHLPWDHRMQSGRTLWDDMVLHYDRGAAKTVEMTSIWQGLEGYVDPQRHAEVEAMLKIQQREARWWRDASLAFWQSVNGLPLPAGTRVPENSLEHYHTLIFPEAPGQ
jgi:alpha-glucuronidase